METVIGGEFKIPLLGIETKESDNGIFFASGRGAFASILKRIIANNNTIHKRGGGNAA